MENQHQNNTNQNQHLSPAPDTPLEKKRRFWKFAVWFVAIIAAALAVASLAYYVSPEARRERELQRNYLQYQKGMGEFEAAMRADTYGGKTPQETLNMFVDALKDGDVELASKCFSLETNTKSPDYLTRKRWEEGIRKAKEEGKLEEIIKLVSGAGPYPQDNSNKEDFKFTTKEGDEIKMYIDTGLNKYSGVWKIESL